MKKVLVIAAHPDDEVYGLGGTIARLAYEGNEIHVLIVTDGSTSQYRNNDNLLEIIKIKKIETEKVRQILNIKSIIYGNLPDMKLDTIPHIEINQLIESTIELIKPEIVFTHFWGDVNKDHRCIYESTIVAVRPIKKQSVKELYCYRVPSSTEWSPSILNNQFLPNTFVDISNFIEQKSKAILTYKTELRGYPHPRSVEYVKKQDEITGLKFGVSNAEEFMLLRKILV